MLVFTSQGHLRYLVAMLTRYDKTLSAKLYFGAKTWMIKHTAIFSYNKLWIVAAITSLWWIKIIKLHVLHYVVLKFIAQAKSGGDYSFIFHIGVDF